MEAFDDLLLYGLEDLWMVVAEEEGPMPPGIIDVFIAVYVPLVGTRRVRDVDAVGLDVTSVVGDATREQRTGAISQSG
jgi:hypothetical protein